MLLLIKCLLLQIINDIDTGNSNIDELKQNEIIHLLLNIQEGDQQMSKRTACDYLGISRASFDNYVRNGLIPKGLERDGFKEKSWLKRDLDKFLDSLEQNSNKFK